MEHGIHHIVVHDVAELAELVEDPFQERPELGLHQALDILQENELEHLGIDELGDVVNELATHVCGPKLLACRDERLAREPAMENILRQAMTPARAP